MIYENVSNLLVKLGIEKSLVEPEASLADKLGIDSTEMVELNLLLRKTFGCSLPKKWYQNKTVADLVKFVEKNIA